MNKVVGYQMGMIAFSACPICGASNITLKFNGFTNRNPTDGRTWPVFECHECGHGFINPQPNNETLTEYYCSSYEAYDEQHGSPGDDAIAIAEATRTGQFRHIPIPKGKRLLDFGCGGGFFLRICRALGAEVQGIEPSPHGAELTRKQGIPVFEGTLDQFLEAHPGERFDVITASHVIEHVPDPIRTLAGLRTLLAPDGYMTIAVPNAASTFALRLGAVWHNTDLPFHLHQFSPASMTQAAMRAGLSSIDLSTVSLPAASAHSLQMVLRKKWLIPERFSRCLPGMHWLGARIAAKQDAEQRGEALLARLQA